MLDNVALSTLENLSSPKCFSEESSKGEVVEEVVGSIPMNLTLFLAASLVNVLVLVHAIGLARPTLSGLGRENIDSFVGPARQNLDWKTSRRDSSECKQTEKAMR